MNKTLENIVAFIGTVFNGLYHRPNEATRIFMAILDHLDRWEDEQLEKSEFAKLRFFLRTRSAEKKLIENSFDFDPNDEPCDICERFLYFALQNNAVKVWNVSKWENRISYTCMTLTNEEFMQVVTLSKVLARKGYTNLVYCSDREEMCEELRMRTQSEEKLINESVFSYEHRKFKSEWLTEEVAYFYNREAYECDGEDVETCRNKILFCTDATDIEALLAVA